MIGFAGFQEFRINIFICYLSKFVKVERKLVREAHHSFAPRFPQCLLRSIRKQECSLLLFNSRAATINGLSAVESRLPPGSPNFFAPNRSSTSIST
mmetsp:Transcript_38551/g.56660  ORF Transcript_38551/g.56660 Transcript_38551/m.56660 type:complete len:96 (-) Transcript_38551:1187-1474(-)